MKKFLKKDKKAKSTSYFFKLKIPVFSKKFLDFIEGEFKKKNEDLRICLHKNQKNKHHDMIILQQKKNFYTPHKHKKKGETYNMIKGQMILLFFNHRGKIIFSRKLLKGDIVQIPTNMFHSTIPLTKYVIFHESKIGPFFKNENITVKWGGRFKNSKNYKKIKNTLYN